MFLEERFFVNIIFSPITEQPMQLLSSHRIYLLIQKDNDVNNYHYRIFGDEYFLLY